MLYVSLRTAKLRPHGHQPVTYGYLKSFKSIRHVYPGILFFSWGLYWLVHAYKQRFQSSSLGRNFTSKPWYPFLLAGKWLYTLEPTLKVLAGPLGMSIELYFDSPDGFRPLYCNDTGRFAAEYVHNYQHASSYPGFLVSGLVDFLGMFLQLPKGTEQVFLSLAFGIEGFLMVLHKKHTPLDMITHELLGYTMLAGSFGVLLELRARGEFLISVFRSFAVMVQGVWLIAMGQMMFTHSTSWNDDYGGPAMMAPPLFAMLTLLTAIGSLLLFVGMQSWHSRALCYSSLPMTSKAAELPEERPHTASQFSDCTLDDSANETSDDGSEPNEQPQKPRTSRTQLAAAFNVLKAGRQKTPSKSSEHII